jgi:hypothetical protein
MLAALFGSRDVVHILIANGGKVNARLSPRVGRGDAR